ncbi:hypothetical protein N0824_02299 [Microcystis sp. 0824]|nr:hypothetical protein N0824_02299 [Microcystis sp. 0824]
MLVNKSLTWQKFPGLEADQTIAIERYNRAITPRSRSG